MKSNHSRMVGFCLAGWAALGITGCELRPAAQGVNCQATGEEKYLVYVDDEYAGSFGDYEVYDNLVKFTGGLMVGAFTDRYLFGVTTEPRERKASHDVSVRKVRPDGRPGEELFEIRGSVFRDITAQEAYDDSSCWLVDELIVQGELFVGSQGGRRAREAIDRIPLAQ